LAKIGEKLAKLVDISVIKKPQELMKLLLAELRF
jgi:hypothetical protein